MYPGFEVLNGVYNFSPVEFIKFIVSLQSFENCLEYVKEIHVTSLIVWSNYSIELCKHHPETKLVQIWSLCYYISRLLS
jgi:hypothetical protein